jgi:uncharacterized protein Smg (DUF494 family)
MVSEIVDVIVKVFKGIKNDYSVRDVEKSLLSNNTYHKNIIAAAYSWIYEKNARDKIETDKINVLSEDSFRILSNEERIIFGEEIEIYIMQLYNIGLLNNKDIDKIVEQVQLFPENAKSKDNINLLILSLFFDTDKKSLPGSRYLLYSSDTVN